MKKIIYTIINRLKYYKSEFEYKRKIALIYSNIKPSVKDTKGIEKHVKYWSRLKKNINPKWFTVYSFLSKNNDIKYVPENIYYNVIEPKLNNRELSFSFKDKNFYDLFYEKDVFPTNLVRNINGIFYNHNYDMLNLNNDNLVELLIPHNKIIIKPSIESGGGKNIEMFELKNDRFINDKNEELSKTYLQRNFHENYVVQKFISQDSFFTKFNETSVNTIRMYTYRSVKNDNVCVLHSLLRIGKKGSIVDNQAMGGISCIINEENNLNDYAINKFGQKFRENNNVVFSEVGAIPKLKEMKELVKKLAAKNIHSRIMGFDLCLDESGDIKVIEINNQYAEINFYQMNGSPLFGNYTDEVLDYCKNNY